MAYDASRRDNSKLQSKKCRLKHALERAHCNNVLLDAVGMRSILECFLWCAGRSLLSPSGAVVVKSLDIEAASF